MNLFGSPPFVCLEREREGGKERERVKVILILFIVGELLLNIYFN